MLEYTTTVADNNKTVSITFTTDVDFSEGSIVNVFDNTNVDWLTEGTSTVIFSSIQDSVYLLTFFNNTSNEFETDYLMINSQSILKGNQLNRIDVDNYLKVKKLTINSRVIDCLNRVAIANFRVNKELRASQILDLISKQEVC